MWGLKALADGRVLAAADGDVKLLANGQVVRSYDVPGEDTWFNIAISLDGASFWGVNAFSPSVYRFSIDSGELLSQFDSGDGLVTTQVASATLILEAGEWRFMRIGPIE